MATQTPLQALAETLSDTAQTPLEMCEAEIAQLDADFLARVALMAARLEQCPVTVRSRTLRGKTVR